MKGGVDTTCQIQREGKRRRDGGKEVCHLRSITLHLRPSRPRTISSHSGAKLSSLNSQLSYHTALAVVPTPDLSEAIPSGGRSRSSATVQLPRRKKNPDFCACTTASFFMMHAQKIKARSMRGMPRRCLCHRIVLDDASLLPFKHKGKSQGQSWLTIG